MAPEMPTPKTSADFVADLRHAITSNPVPAVLVGAGLFWILAGRRATTLGDLPGSFARGLSGAAINAGANAMRGVSAAGDLLGAGADAVAKGIGDAAAATSDIARAASEAVSGSADDRDPRSSIVAATGRTAANVFEDQPLLLGLAGIAAGAVLAAVFPVTEIEEDYLSDASSKVRNVADEAWDRATGRASELVSATLSEAKDQGLTPDAASRLVSSGATKLAGMVGKIAGT